MYCLTAYDIGLREVGILVNFCGCAIVSGRGGGGGPASHLILTVKGGEGLAIDLTINDVYIIQVIHAQIKWNGSMTMVYTCFR